MSITNSKKDFLKLLARTSIVAMTALSAGSAVAANVTINGAGAANVDTGANTDKGGALDHHDTLVYDAGNPQDITFNAVRTLHGLDLNGQDLGANAINVTDAANDGGIGAVGNAGANGIDLNLAFGGPYTFNLTGEAAAANVAAGDYSGLRNISIGQGAQLDVNSKNAAITLLGTIDGAAAGKGFLKLEGANQITINNNVGATKALQNLIVHDAKVTFNKNVSTTTLTLSDATSTANFADGVVITGVIDNKVGADYKGTLNFAGAGQVTGAAGTTNKGFAAVNLNGAGTVAFNGILNSEALTFTNDNAILQLSGDTTIANGIKGSKSYANGGGGTIHINGDLDFTGTIGTSANAVKTLKFTDAMKTLTLLGDNTHYVASILPQANNKNVIIVNADQTIYGNIGKYAERLSSVSVAANRTLTLVGNAYTNAGMQFANDASKLILTKNNSVVNILDAPNAAGDGVIEVNATGVSLGSIGATNALNKLQINKDMSATITDEASFHTNGIYFNGAGTLSLTKDKTLTFANNAKVDAAAVGDGTLILNNHTITSKIGQTKAIGTIRVDGGTATLQAASKAIEVQPGENVSDAKLKLEDDLTVGTAANAGKVGAFAEVDFQGDHTLHVESNGTAIFDPVQITTKTANEGIISIKTVSNITIPAEFSTADGNKLNKLNVEFTGTIQEENFASLTGDVLNVGELHIESPANTKIYGFSVGQNAGNSENKPQVIIGNFTENGAEKNAIDVKGHVYFEGDIRAALAFRTEDKNAYVTGDINDTIQFSKDTNLYLTSGDTDISNILVSGIQNGGSIIATGAKLADARKAFLAGDASYNITATNFTDTLTFDNAAVATVSLGNIVNKTSRLGLIDAGNGTVQFTGDPMTKAIAGADDARISKLVANKLVLNRDGGVYDISTLEAGPSTDTMELHIAHNTKIAANSTMLGSENNPTKARLTFNAGNARTLTLNDNVNINLLNGDSKAILGNSGKAQNLNFVGNSNVYSILGTAASAFDTISVTPAAKGQKVTFHEDVVTANGISLADANATAIVKDNVTGGIVTTKAQQGTLYLSGSDKTIDAIGDNGGNGLATVIMNSDKSKVTGAFHTQNVRFDTDGELTINKASVIGDSVTSKNIGTLLITGGNHEINYAVGDNISRFKAIKMGTGTNTLTIADNNGFMETNLLPESSGAGTVIFTGGANSEYEALDIGMKGSEFAAVNFNNAATLRDAHATNINVNDKAVSLRNAHGITNLTAGGNATILDGGYAKARGAGTLTIARNATIDEAGTAASPLGILSTEASGIVALNSNIHSAAFNHKYATVNIAADTNVSGTYTATDATLGTAGTFEVAGNSTLSGKIQVNDTSKGVILDMSASGADVTNLTSLNILFDGSKGSALKSGRTIISFNEDMEDHAFTKAITLSSNNALFADVSLETSATHGILKVNNTVNTAVKGVNLPVGEKGALERILLDNIDNEIFTNELVYAPGGFSDAARRFGSTETITTIENVNTSVMRDSSERTAQRMNYAITINGASPVNTKAELIGVAAGDASEKLGLWANALFGTSSQGSRKHSTAFKSNNAGALVGIDTMLDDKTIFGFAMGNSQGNTKFKDFKAGDKIKTSSWVFTGYGSYNVTDQIFVRASLTGASTKVDSSEKRLGQQLGAAYAKGKYHVEAFDLEAAVGYKHTYKSGTITPYVGLNLGRVNDIDYKETGAGVLNKEIKQNASHNSSVLAGAAFQTEANWDGMDIAPEAHVNLRYGIGAKTPKGKYKLLGTTKFANYAGDKPSRLAINVGGSVTSHIDNIEYGVGYDAHLADKYVGHQGSLKVKVKF